MRVWSVLILSATKVLAETWLAAHSFSEPLHNAALAADWDLIGSCNGSVNGLNLVSEASTSWGSLTSKFPLMTNSFQVIMGISVTSNGELKTGDALNGDPGFMLFLQSEGQEQNEPSGDFYGRAPTIEGHGVYFALTSREHKISPSISFGYKGLERIQTPLPRGIYWNYLDKNEFEVMLDVTNGTEIIGYIRAKSSDRWTQAFNENIGIPIKSTAKLVLSALNTDMPVGYTISRIQVVSQDDNQPGYRRQETHRVADHEQGDSELSLNERFDQFYEEQRSINKAILHSLDTIKGQLQESEADDLMVKMTNKMESMQRTMHKAQRNQQSDRKINESFSQVENMFAKLSSRAEIEDDKGKTQWMMFLSVLLILVSGMGYVIYHMKRLEKKHIL